MESGVTPPFLSGVEQSPQARPIEQYLRDARAGSLTALGQALEASRKYLLMVANRSLEPELRQKVGASDLVQDTFVEAHQDFDGFLGTTEQELLAWLTAILSNRLSNNVRHWRKRQKRSIDRELAGDAVEPALAGLRDSSLTPCTTTVVRDEDRRLREALEQLDEQARQILIARNWQRASFAEIGATRGCSAEAARKQWASAVRKLKQALNHIVSSQAGTDAKR